MGQMNCGNPHMIKQQENWKRKMNEKLISKPCLLT